MDGRSKKPRHVANRANASNSSQPVSNRNYKANLIRASSPDVSNRNYKANLIRASSPDENFTETFESELSQERRELFRKKLSECDVKTHLKIEHNDALEFFPTLSNDKDKVVHEVSDSHAKLWKFEPKADTDDPNGGIFLCGDWKKFSMAKGLRVNDEVVFYEKQGFWIIDIERNREKDGRQGDFIGLGKRKTMAQTGHKEMEGHLNMMTNTMVADNARSSSETLLNVSPDSQAGMANRSCKHNLAARDYGHEADEVPGRSSSQGGDEFRELSWKKLAKTDVEDHLRLSNDGMLNNFLKFQNESNAASLGLPLRNDDKEIPLELEVHDDSEHVLWKFTGYQSSEEVQVLYFNNGWKDFVKTKGVKENDIIVFNTFGKGCGEHKKSCLMIRIERNGDKVR